jgi:ABC-type transporter Mla subunit MlaD
MKQRSTDAPEAVLKFAPKDKSRDDDPTDQSGRAVVALLQQAANQTNDTCDRAMALAHKLSVQLRAAEEQIQQLHGQLEHFQRRAARAEEWLLLIRKEIEERLLVPRTPSGPGQTFAQ